MEKKLVLSCVQPSYLAWIPLFKRILAGDVFVHLDDVEFSKNSFHNRNSIKGPQGSLLLTVPVKYKGHSRNFINEIPVDNSLNWQIKHWRSIEMNYRKAPNFKELGPIVKDRIFDQEWDNLADLNITFIEIIKEFLRIERKTFRSSEFGLKSTGNQKLVDLCKILGAEKFLVKPGAEGYHPSSFF